MFSFGAIAPALKKNPVLFFFFDRGENKVFSPLRSENLFKKIYKIII
jgi:hypothetical protein